MSNSTPYPHDESADPLILDRLFIGGEWIAPKSGRMIESIDPATEKVWAHVAEADSDDIDLAVDAATAALHGPWHNYDPGERGRLLYRLAELVRENAESLSYWESRDNGKPHRDTRGEMQRAADWLTYYAGAADKLLGAQIPYKIGSLAYTRREPVGVVGAILPWNSPILLCCWKLGPALASGNTMIIKPAEQTPVSLIEFAKLVEKAGFPAGVVNVTPGYGKIAGAALVAHKGVNKISFTGHHETAIHIMRAASANLKRCSFECGGKSPFIVFDDAHLEKAISVAVHSAFRSTGQSCSLASRMFVQRSVYEKFADAVAERAGRIRVGPPMDEKTHIGPHTSAEQLDKSNSYIEMGRDSGARLLTGGGRPAHLKTGYYIEPTVFADVDPASRLAREEVFGPVLAIMPFDDEEEVIGLANSTDYGLVGGLWTSNISRAHRVAEQIQAGLVSVNTFRPVHWMLPYGGFKLSGIGRENGMDAFDEFTETKTIVVDLSSDIPPDPFAN